jgi:cation diffusion facilitator family transporter
MLVTSSGVPTNHGGSSKSVIYAALAGNVMVAVCKFVAAAWTGSAAMLAEAIHSLVDTGNEVLLLYGLRRARTAPTAERPFGFGREVYFWSFIVALLIFAIGGGVAILEGSLRILNPRPIKDVYISYIVIALAFMFEGASWWFAVRKIGGSKAAGGYLNEFRRSKDPTSFMVLFEDSAALLGLLIAFAGISASSALGAPVLDGVASVIIGLILTVTAVLLANETKSLLIGEPANEEVVESISRLAQLDTDVTSVNAVLTAQLAPDQIVALLSVEFDDKLTTSALETKVAEMEERIRAAHSDVVTLFIKPQTPSEFAKARQRRGFDEESRAPGSSTRN